MSMHSSRHLKRSLTLPSVIIYGIGASVGAGIYSLVGIGASVAGPAVSISFLLCGIACIFTALPFAEFASRTSATGSAYTYAHIFFGEDCAWFVGWNLSLEYGLTAAVVARSWAEYVCTFCRGMLEWWFGGNSAEEMKSILFLEGFAHWEVFPGYICSPLSIVVVGICTLILLLGVEESSKFNTCMVFLNLSVLAFVVLCGIMTNSIHLSNMTPFAPHGVPGIARGMGLLFFSFIGFDMVACLSEEVQNPEVNMPLGIIGSLLCIICIYVCVALGVVGMAPIALLGREVPVSNALLANACCTHSQQLEFESGYDVMNSCLDTQCQPIRNSFLLYASQIVSGGAVFGLTTATFTSMMGQPRILYKISKDGLIPKCFSYLDKKTQVPTTGILINGALVSILACFTDLEAMANVICIGTLQIFTFVNVGVIILRLRDFNKDPGTPVLKKTHYMSSDESAKPPPPQSTTQPCEDTIPSSNSSTETTPLCQPEPEFPSIRSIDITNEDDGEEEESEILAQYDNFTPVFYSCIFIVSVTLGSMLYNNPFLHITYFVTVPVSIVILMGIVYSTCILLFGLKYPTPTTKHFTCPYVPIIPLIGTAFNSYMMGSLPLYSWLCLAIYTGVGVLVYKGYSKIK